MTQEELSLLNNLKHMNLQKFDNDLSYMLTALRDELNEKYKETN